MEPNEKCGPLANEVSERILSAIYGPDLTGCQVTPETIAPIIQEALNAQTEREQTLNGLFVQVLEKILMLLTPPSRSEIKDPAHLASILGERADAIHVVVTETLNAWRKLNTPQ